MAQDMSQEDAKKEIESINEDIAKEKGIDPKTGEPVEDVEEEPGAKKDEEETPDGEDGKQKRDKDAKLEDDTDTEEDDEEQSEESQRRPKQRIPLSKLQDFKKKTREEKADLIRQIGEMNSKILELQGKIDSSKGSEERKKKVADYAEKHGKTTEEVEELLDLLPQPAIDPKLQEDTKVIHTEAEKIKANKAFDDEFSNLIEESPDAAEHKDAIRKLAFKEENLTKSLYEIYHRSIETEPVVRKKTGESSRGANRAAAPATDVGKIVENVKKNVPGALDNLSDETLDKVFEELGRTGSRYTR